MPFFATAVFCQAVAVATAAAIFAALCDVSLMRADAADDAAMILLRFADACR